RSSDDEHGYRRHEQEAMPSKARREMGHTYSDVGREALVPEVLATYTFEWFHSGATGARPRHTWSVNLPVFFPMPEGREFPDPPRCAFCNELGRPIRPEPAEKAEL